MALLESSDEGVDIATVAGIKGGKVPVVILSLPSANPKDPAILGFTGKANHVYTELNRVK